MAARQVPFATLGAITEAESLFHYNVTENSILRAVLRRQPPARGAMIEATRMLTARQGRRQLDIGSGTGHWVDFMRRAFVVQHATAVEIAEPMAAFLREKYADQPVRVETVNVAEDGLDLAALGGPFHYITAIGVMFHITDDARWETAVHNLAAALAPGGLLIVGGEFGTETRNVQFHKSDAFGSWREFDKAEGEQGVVRVNKRVRSLARWVEVATAAGLKVADLVRSDRDELILTPENDVLLLVREA